MIRGKTLSKRVWVENIPKHALFVDTETSEDSEGNLSLLLGCYELWRVGKTGKRIRMLNHGVFDTESEFHSVMRDSATSRVIAHNWNFDASVLRIASSDNRKAFGYSIDFANSIMPNEPSTYSPFLLRLDYAGAYAELLDNTNFYTLPLASLGESLQIPKLEMPTTDQRSSMIAYCYRDVEILREAYFRLFEFVAQFQTTPSITTASASMRIFRRYFYERKNQAQGSQHIEAVNHAERMAYHGGRTDIFWKGKPKTSNPIYKYDVNSLYPSCMLEDIPVRYIQSYRGYFDCKAYKGISGARNHLGLYDVSLSIPKASKYATIGLEGVFTDNGLIFPIGDFRCYLWQPLYDIAVAQGYVVETHKTLIYDAESLFKGFIESMYALRQEYKRAGNFAYDLLTKLIMNSLYGKFGQRAYGEWREVTDSAEYAFVAQQTESDLERLVGYWDSEAAHYLRLSDKVWKYDDSQIGGLATSSICSIAGYITAMGRAVVWQAMASIIDAGAQIYMCDTDSVVCDTPLPASMISDTELGKWKLEGVSKAADCNFIAPKHYVYKGEIKLKGVRNPIIGADSHKQARFPRFMTDLSSKNKRRQANLEHGGRMLYIESSPTGINHKRVEQGEGLPTLPIVI